jgi:choline-sulfatase
MPTRPPNFVIIMSDEHDGGVMGCMGDGVVRTPHLDRLASRGVLFRSCYTPSPVCGPARLAFTLGRYSSRDRIWSNHSIPTSDKLPSLARQLQEVGYRTFLCGKQHYMPGRRYGFSDLGKDYNSYEKTGYIMRRDPEDESINHALAAKRFADFRVSKDSGIYRHDEPITARATRFIENQSSFDSPYMLFVGFKSPHFPLIAPRCEYRKVKGKVPMPVIPEGMVESQPLNYQHLRRAFGVVDTDPDMVRLGRELYYALVGWMDKQVGAVIKSVRESYQRDNTVIIYLSDHGENKGDHHLWWKNCMYEHAARIPLIVNWPERWEGKQVRKGPCSSLDVVQTILDLAGVESPDDWDGHSLVPWLEDKEHDWKRLAVSEYYAHNVCSGFSMIRKGPYKYVYHTEINARYGSEKELYNLEEDPAELKNLAAKKPEICNELHQALVAETGEDPEELEQRARYDYAKAKG